MDNEHLEAARALIDFARNSAADIYNADRADLTPEQVQSSIEYILDAASKLEEYLDS